MIEIAWTLGITIPSMIGLWLAPRHWSGWAIGAATEVIWAAYSWYLWSLALAVMSAIWLALYLRNTVVSYREQR